LPPYDAFYSQLKSHNTLEAERDEFERMLEQGHGIQQVLKKMHIQTPPKTGPQKYEDLWEIWNSHGMTRFQDWLEFYNNLDVKPCVEAVTRMQAFYRGKGVDQFKQSISVPGIARLLLFQAAREANVSFPLFDYKNSDLHDLYKRNTIGGASLIFHRYHCAGETKIRGGTETCQKVRIPFTFHLGLGHVKALLCAMS
jgi:hypothetical protein